MAMRKSNGVGLGGDGTSAPEFVVSTGIKNSQSEMRFYGLHNFKGAKHLLFSNSFS